MFSYFCIPIVILLYKDYKICLTKAQFLAIMYTDLQSYILRFFVVCSKIEK